MHKDRFLLREAPTSMPKWAMKPSTGSEVSTLARHHSSKLHKRCYFKIWSCAGGAWLCIIVLNPRCPWWCFKVKALGSSGWGKTNVFSFHQRRKLDGKEKRAHPRSQWATLISFSAWITAELFMEKADVCVCVCVCVWCVGASLGRKGEGRMKNEMQLTGNF